MAAEGPFDLIGTWVNFGVLGVVVISLIVGWLWTKPSVDRLVEEKQRLIDERDRAMAQRDAMATVLENKLLPVVGDFITTTRALLPMLQEIQKLQELSPVIQELARQAESDPRKQPRRRWP